MRCFKHPKLEAVGICSSCNKGVCSKCAIQEDDKIYCKDCISRSKIVDRCYNHPRSEAIGRCSSCKKLICADCAIEKDDKLYCRLCSSRLPAEFEPPAALEAAEAPQRTEVIAASSRRLEEKRIPRLKVEIRVNPSETVSSTIIGGIFGGFMMGLPFINLLLVWAALGGMLAVYILRIRLGYENGYVKMKDALTVGAISGVFSAVIATFFNIIYAVLLQSQILQVGQSLYSMGIQMDLVDLILKLAVTEVPYTPVLFILIKLIVTIVLFAFLGAIGGAISSELSRR